MIILSQVFHSKIQSADKLLIYRWAGGNFDHGDPVEPAVEQARILKEQGVRAIKLNACPPMHSIDISRAIDQAVARAGAIREAVGEEVGLAFDFHGRVSAANALSLARALKFVKPLFIEEPVAPENNHWLPTIAKAGVRIATGERMFDPALFADICAKRAVHVLQPDLVHIGGISRTNEVAKLANAFDIVIAPHCPMGPVAFMACCHVLFANRSGAIQECSDGIHYNEVPSGNPFTDYLVDQAPVIIDRDGCIPLPVGPGLGIDLDWERIQKAAVDQLPWTEPSPVSSDGQPVRW
jgi:galactonate dehydratase